MSDHGRRPSHTEERRVIGTGVRVGVSRASDGGRYVLLSLPTTTCRILRVSRARVEVDGPLDGRRRDRYVTGFRFGVRI